MEQSTTMRVIPGPDAADADEALISFGIATASRDAAIAIGIGLGLLYLFPVPWAGLGLLAAWAAAALLVLGLLLRFGRVNEIPGRPPEIGTSGSGRYRTQMPFSSVRVTVAAMPCRGSSPVSASSHPR